MLLLPMMIMILGTINTDFTHKLGELMKCDSYRFKRITNPKNGKGRWIGPFRQKDLFKLLDEWAKDSTSVESWLRGWKLTEDDLDKFEGPCGGNIICTIDAKEEPYYGGCSAALDVEYKCDKCGQINFYPELPSYSSELSKFITKIIAEM